MAPKLLNFLILICETVTPLSTTLFGKSTPIIAGKAPASFERVLAFLASTKSSDDDLTASSLEISAAPMTQFND